MKPFATTADEEKFFHIVQTTPDYHEALDMLERAKIEMVRAKFDAAARRQVALEKSCEATIIKINLEKKAINNVLQDMGWHDAVRATLGQEALDAVVGYRIATYRKGRNL